MQPTTTQPCRTKLYVIAAAVAVFLLAGGLTAYLVLRPGSTPGGSAGTDPGVKACQMMAEDKHNGTTPDDARGKAEIDAMAASGNADLRKAASLLASSDMSEQMQAIGPLYAGCQALGVTIG